MQEELTARRQFALQPCQPQLMAQRRLRCQDMVHHCLPSPDQAGLRQRISHRLCERLSCEYMDHLAEHARLLSAWEVARLALMATIITVSVLLYIVLLIEWSEAKDKRSHRQQRDRYAKDRSSDLETSTARDYTDSLLQQWVSAHSGSTTSHQD